MLAPEVATLHLLHGQTCVPAKWFTTYFDLVQVQGRQPLHHLCQGAKPQHPRVDLRCAVILHQRWRGRCQQRVDANAGEQDVMQAHPVCSVIWGSQLGSSAVRRYGTKGCDAGCTKITGWIQHPHIPSAACTTSATPPCFCRGPRFKPYLTWLRSLLTACGLRILGST